MDTSYKAEFNIRQFWQLLSFSKYLLFFDIAELSLLHRADTRGTERPFIALTHPPTRNNKLILRPLRNENLFLIDRLASGCISHVWPLPWKLPFYFWRKHIFLLRLPQHGPAWFSLRPCCSCRRSAQACAPEPCKKEDREIERDR